MIKLNTNYLHALSAVPELPFVTLATLDADYPRDERIPTAMWKVSLACGDAGAGSYGYGPTLEIALQRSAVHGWTPVRAFIVEVVWGRHWSGGSPRRVCKADVQRGRGKGTWAEQLVREVIAPSLPTKPGVDETEVAS